MVIYFLFCKFLLSFCRSFVSVVYFLLDNIELKSFVFVVIRWFIIFLVRFVFVFVS